MSTMKWAECISRLIKTRTVSEVKLFSQRTYYEYRTMPLHYCKLYHRGDFAFYHSIKLQERKVQDASPFIITSRNYAKGKDKKKEKVKHKVVIDERMLAEIIPLDDIKDQLQKAVNHLKDQYIQTLSIRSSTGAIENLRISYEGKDYTMQELGQIFRKDTKTVIINMSAFPQAIPAALEALEKSGMNLNPQQDGTTLFIPVPKVTTEHRDQLAKNAKTLFIQCRDTLKNVQLKHEKKLKNSSLAQDTVFSAQQQLGTLTENYISMADSLLQSKVKELTGK